MTKATAQMGGLTRLTKEEIVAAWNEAVPESKDKGIETYLHLMQAVADAQYRKCALSPARVAEGGAGDLSRYTCESRGEVPAPESPAKEQPGEWIPKSERLPELGVDVLIYHVLGDRDRPEVPHAYDVGWLLKDGWYFPWDRGRDRQRPMFVTHWMPLPPPPPERP